MFGWEFPPHNSGGLGTACEGIAKALIADGAELIFVLPRRVDVSLPGVRFVFADVPIAAGVSPYIGRGEFSKVYGGSLVEQVKFYALRAREIAVREAGNFDIIHAHDWLSFGAGTEAKNVSGKPLVVHIHATQFDHSGGRGADPVLYALEKQGFEQADAIAAVSGFTKSNVIEHYGVDPDKISVVHNGVDDDSGVDLGATEWVYGLEQKKKNGTKIVLFLGRITLMKGPDYFLKVAAKVAGLYPNVLFVMGGSGDMEGQMVRQATKLGIANKVLFAGFVRGNERVALYRAADLYVLPSVSEPFGITPLEALVQGTPVLISKQSGVSEVLSHALKADFWDVDDMTDKIVAVLRHSGLAATLKVNGHREALGVTWAKAAQKLRDLYTKVLGFFKKLPKV